MIKLRKFKKTDSENVAFLIFNTYKKFNSKEFIKKSAIQEYLNFYDTAKNSNEQLYKRFLKTPIFFIVIENNKIIGMIRGTSERIVNLFVEGRKHKKGIGRLLVNKFELEAKNQNSKEIKIRASLFATSFYQKMGYKKTTGIRNFRGLKIQPMKKKM